MRFALVIFAMLLAFGSIGTGMARAQTDGIESGLWQLAAAGQNCLDECCADCPEFEHCKVVCGAAMLPPALAESPVFPVHQHREAVVRSIDAHDRQPQPPPPRPEF